MARRLKRVSFRRYDSIACWTLLLRTCPKCKRLPKNQLRNALLQILRRRMPGIWLGDVDRDREGVAAAHSVIKMDGIFLKLPLDVPPRSQESFQCGCASTPLKGLSL